MGGGDGQKKKRKVSKFNLDVREQQIEGGQNQLWATDTMGNNLWGSSSTVTKIWGEGQKGRIIGRIQMT